MKNPSLFLRAFRGVCVLCFGLDSMIWYVVCMTHGGFGGQGERGGGHGAFAEMGGKRDFGGGVGDL